MLRRFKMGVSRKSMFHGASSWLRAMAAAAKLRSVKQVGLEIMAVLLVVLFVRRRFVCGHE